ncbi:MAG: DUF3987 domain-containing protein [Planctomycetes bacterium]|nr:DUF3987 domain-containing protein [Planctomycetota bacterium]
MGAVRDHPPPDATRLTAGAGTSNPQGRSVSWDGTADGLARILRGHTGHETWWAPGRFRDDYRKVSTEQGEEPRWLGSRLVGVDVDFHNGKQGHAHLTAEVADSIAASPPPCSLWHLTPAGVRIVFVLDHELTDVALWRRVARGAVSVVSEWVTRARLTGLQIDAGASCDPARFFFAPTCRAKGADRTAEVHVTGDGPYDALALGDLPTAAESHADTHPPGDIGDIGDMTPAGGAGGTNVTDVTTPPRVSRTHGASTPYGLAALERERARVVASTPGQRNDTLFRAAANIAELVAGGEIDHDTAHRTLLEAACQVGLGEIEARRTIESAFRTGERTPRTAPAPAALTRGAPPAAAPDQGAAPDEPWGEPVPLIGEVTGPPLPIDVLPSWAVEAVRHVAANVQAPLDYVIGIALGLIAAGVMGRWLLTFNGYTVHPNLHVLGVLPSGERKSAPFGVLLQGVRAAAKTLRERREGEIREHQVRRASLVSTEKALSRAHKKGEATDEEYEAAVRALVEHDADAPRPFELVLDDCTPERATAVGQGTAGLIRILGDEGAFLQHLLGRYSDSPAVELALKGWDGGSVSVHRVGRPDVHLQRVLLAIVASVQPTVLSDLERNDGLLGRGVLARFLLVLASGRAGTRKAKGEAVQKLVLARFAEAVRRIYEQRPAAIDPSGLSEPVRVELSHAAEAVYTRWFDGIERRRAKGCDLAELGDYVNKLEGNCLKVACTLYAAECELLAAPYAGPHEIDAATMDRACRFMEAQLQHQLLARALGGTDPRTRIALVILDRVRADPAAFESGTTLRDVHRSVRRHVNDPEETLAALEYLESLGWLRFDARPVIGRGRPSPTLRFHPNASTHNPRAGDNGDIGDMTPDAGGSVTDVTRPEPPARGDA